MRRLRKLRRIAILLLIAILVGFAGWIYWNRVQTANLTAWAPADSLAYVEVNDLSEIVRGVEQTTAWKSLGPLLGAPDHLAPNRSFPPKDPERAFSGPLLASRPPVSPARTGRFS